MELSCKNQDLILQSSMSDEGVTVRYDNFDPFTRERENSLQFPALIALSLTKAGNNEEKKLSDSFCSI